MAKSRAFPILLILLIPVAVAACLVAAAGAGAGGGIYLTSRGVESIVNAPIERALHASERTFEQMDIERTAYSEEDGGRRRRLEGRAGQPDLDVTVEMEATDSASTHVEVTARSSLVTWDKDYARSVLQRIVDLSI